ncbi:hypothetical protein Bca101_029805 [Brassica carinata]
MRDNSSLSKLSLKENPNFCYCLGGRRFTASGPPPLCFFFFVSPLFPPSSVSSTFPFSAWVSRFVWSESWSDSSGQWKGGVLLLVSVSPAVNFLRLVSLAF